MNGNEKYRWTLYRRTGVLSGRGTVNFIMLNPSTADAEVSDPTVRRCLGFASIWGFAYLSVTNLYSLRSTRPANLWLAADPVGPLTDEHVEREARSADLVIAAWGTHAKPERVAAVVRRLSDQPAVALHVLGLNKGGSPKHPLYVPVRRDYQAWERLP